MSDSKYCYPPDFTVLINKLQIRNTADLEEAERRLVRNRMVSCPTGQFDLTHLKRIHGHLFQDVYEWAGEVRTVSIAKNGSVFMPVKFIETGMADVRKRLVDKNYLRKLPQAEFSQEAGKIIGDVNHAHPFREGNGRTQAIYLQQLGAQAGYTIDLKHLNREAWLEASIQSHNGIYDKFGEVINQVTSIADRRGSMHLSSKRVQNLRNKADNKERRFGHSHSSRKLDREDGDVDR